MPKCSVTKEVTFDCAHMLSGHNGLCKNLHGHTYKVQVTVWGNPIDERCSSNKMIIDFGNLKEAINEVIISQFDHALILSGPEYRGRAEEELGSWVAAYNLRHVVMPTRTTAECMALYFKEKISHYLTVTLRISNIYEVGIRVYETPTSYAEV